MSINICFSQLVGNQKVIQPAPQLVQPAVPVQVSKSNSSTNILDHGLKMFSILFPERILYESMHIPGINSDSDRNWERARKAITLNLTMDMESSESNSYTEAKNV